MKSKAPFLVALAFLLIAPATSSGATTIGSNLTAAPASVFGCGSGCTYMALALPPASTAAGGLSAPTSGVVVRWRIRSGAAPHMTSLRVLRPAGGTSWTGVAESATVTVPASATSTFDTRLPITAGDRIGVDTDTAMNAQATTAGAQGAYWTPALGTSATLPYSGMQTPRELLVNADIEPDADGDGYGDETQDLCPGDATLHAACPRTLTVKVKGRGLVTGNGIDCPGDCSEVFASGDSLQLGAAPADGYVFSGWSGDCTGGADCELAMTSDRKVVATFRDVSSPNTAITKAPPPTTSRHKVKLKFSSSEPGSFECKLDRGPWKGCKSPKKFRVGPGRHKIKVRALDASGNADPSPAKAKFKVKR